MSKFAFECDRELLSRALSFADRISGRQGFGAMTGPPRLKLEMKGNNLTIRSAGQDKSAEVVVKVNGGGNGTAVIPSSLLASIVSKLDDGDVELKSVEGDMRVTCGTAKFALPTASDWGVTWTPPSGGEPAEIVASSLSDAIGRVIKSVHKENYVLRGVLVEKLDDSNIRLVATDGFRLSLRNVQVGSSGELFASGESNGKTQSVLLPGDLLDDIVRAAKEESDDECDARISVEENRATIEVGGIKVTGPLLEGAFPNYRDVIPKKFSGSITVDRDALERAVERVCLVADGERRTVMLSVEPDTNGPLAVKASSSDFGEAEDKVTCEAEGEIPSVMLSSDFLLQGLTSFDAGEVMFSFQNDPKKAVVVRHAEHADDQTYLIMPIVA